MIANDVCRSCICSSCCCSCFGASIIVVAVTVVVTYCSWCCCSFVALAIKVVVDDVVIGVAGAVALLYHCIIVIAAIINHYQGRWQCCRSCRCCC